MRESVGSLNLSPTLDHLPRSFAILPSYAVPVRRHMRGWWRAHPGRSCFLARPIRDRRSSRAHVRTNAARARTCRGGVVSASISSIRRIQFLKGNRRRPLWRSPGFRRRVGTPPVRPFTAIRPTGALRPIEASKDAIRNGRFTSSPDVPGPRVLDAVRGEENDPIGRNQTSTCQA